MSAAFTDVLLEHPESSQHIFFSYHKFEVEKLNVKSRKPLIGLISSDSKTVGAQIL